MNAIFQVIGFIIPISCTLFGCGKEQAFDINQSGIIKKGVIVKNAVGEMTPIMFKGKMYLVGFADNTDDKGFIQVQEYETFEVVSRTPFPYNYGSAIVEGNTVHVFASSDTLHGPGNRIVTATTTDLINFTSPSVIFTAPANQTVYNSSVAKTDTGFVLAYEIHEEGHHAWFYNRFMASTDLATWTHTGGDYDPTAENACPTIRFLNGWYYLFSLHDRGSVVNHSRFFTVVTRSRDLVTFEESPIEVLNNYGRTDEGTNNSDIDFVERDGKMYFVYLVGDQVTFGIMKTGFYNGTFAQFIGEFFKE